MKNFLSKYSREYQRSSRQICMVFLFFTLTTFCEKKYVSSISGQTCQHYYRKCQKVREIDFLPCMHSAHWFVLLQINFDKLDRFLSKLNHSFIYKYLDKKDTMYSLQGISHWNVSFKLTLTDRNRQARICWKVILTSWDYEIWVSSTSFLKKLHILASTASDRNCIRY